MGFWPLFLFDSPSNLLILGISQQFESRSISRRRSGVGRMTSDEKCFKTGVDYWSFKKKKKKKVLTKLYSDYPRHSCTMTHRVDDLLPLYHSSPVHFCQKTHF